MKKYLQWWLILCLLLLVPFGYILLKPAPKYYSEKIYEYKDFEEFYQSKLTTSREKNSRPHNEEKLIRHSDGLAETAILYIHGFGASRAEGELVTDSLAAYLKANAYYLRLPGHGTNKEDHALSNFSHYLREAEEALIMMEKLGSKTIVVGTSMGGLIATYLAAQYPDRIDALILCSPFYDYANIAGKLINIPGMVELVSFFDSQGRISLPEEQIKAGSVLPEFPDYWYTEQKYEALFSLNELKDFAAKEDIYKKVTAPVLLYYYYKNEEEQDMTASVPEMLNAFERFGTNPGHKRKVNIRDGDHVMFSKYVHADREAIYADAINFLDEIFKTKLQEREN